ncbi:hypothetical protein ACFHWD_11370 [Clostridium sp. MT-14]|jgi:hypothetical protein|uniref:hypothetical protein n=1 Tax=Clostridium sp. MT-14 TaxID=3348360 RepID=UPI0035F225E9
MALSEEAKTARRAYQREYRKKHHEHYLERMKEWRAKNKDKVRQHNINYWEKKGRQLKENNDPMNQFIKERCNLSSELSVSNKQLAQAFNEWNNSSLTTSQFSLQFKDTAVELGLQKKRTKYGMLWEGLGLKNVTTLEGEE